MSGIYIKNVMNQTFKTLTAHRNNSKEPINLVVMPKDIVFVPFCVESRNVMLDGRYVELITKEAVSDFVKEEFIKYFTKEIEPYIEIKGGIYNRITNQYSFSVGFIEESGDELIY